MEKRTIMEVMKGTVDKFGDKIALKTKLKGNWEETTWQAYYDQVRTTARAFMALGLEKDSTISILGKEKNSGLGQRKGACRWICPPAKSSRTFPVQPGRQIGFFQSTGTARIRTLPIVHFHSSPHIAGLSGVLPQPGYSCHRSVWHE